MMQNVAANFLAPNHTLLVEQDGQNRTQPWHFPDEPGQNPDIQGPWPDLLHAQMSRNVRFCPVFQPLGPNTFPAHFNGTLSRPAFLDNSLGTLIKSRQSAAGKAAARWVSPSFPTPV